MKKLQALVFTAALFFQVPVTWAQGQQPQQPTPDAGSRNSVTPSPWSTSPSGPDVCLAVPLTISHLPPSLDPPLEWRGKYANIYINLRQDGSVEDAHLLHPSGNTGLDAAAMAQVRQSWRWAPLACGRDHANQQVTVRVPTLTCVANGWTPPPPLTFAQPGRDVSAALNVEVAQDGRMLKITIAASSGDAGVDAALLAYVQNSWRFWPLAEGCPNAIRHVFYRFPEMACIPKPVMESRTAPSVAPQRQQRAVDLQMGVGSDGKLLFTNIARSSGDAGLDAAAVAHVKEAWRWQPITCKRTVVYQRGEALPVMDFAHIPLGGVTN
jgi:TonB family protein